MYKHDILSSANLKDMLSSAIDIIIFNVQNISFIEYVIVCHVTFHLSSSVKCIKFISKYMYCLIII